MAHGTSSTTEDFFHLPIGAAAPAIVNVVVEIPSGGRNKIEYDRNYQIFRLDRALHSPEYYPGDYGFIPRTLAQDGDPLDVLVLVTEPTFSGCVMEVRPIGYLHLIDEGVPDEKILAVPRGEPDYANIASLADVSAHVIRKIQHFFETYKLLEGKHTSSEGWRDKEAALAVIRDAQKRFTESEDPPA